MKKEGQLPGKVFVSLPDPEQTVVAGAFTAASTETDGAAPAALQAQPGAPAAPAGDGFANPAERAGKKVVAVEWAGARNFVPSLNGPVVDYRNFFSTRGVLAFPLDPDEQAGAAAFGVSYQVAAFAPASGWNNVPPSDPAAPAMQAQLTVATTFAAQNPTRIYDIYIYASIVDGVAPFDRILTGVQTCALPISSPSKNSSGDSRGSFPPPRLLPLGAGGIVRRKGTAVQWTRIFAG